MVKKLKNLEFEDSSIDMEIHTQVHTYINNSTHADFYVLHRHIHAQPRPSYVFLYCTT